MCLYKLKLLSLSCLLLFRSCRRFISRHHVSSFSSACSGRTLKSLNHILEHCSPMATCAGILFRIKNLSIQKKKITQWSLTGNLPRDNVCKINLFKQKDFSQPHKRCYLWGVVFQDFQTGLSFRPGSQVRKVAFSLFHRKYIFDIISMKKKIENPLFVPAPEPTDFCTSLIFDMLCFLTTCTPRPNSSCRFYQTPYWGDLDKRTATACIGANGIFLNAAMGPDDNEFLFSFLPLNHRFLTL